MSYKERCLSYVEPHEVELKQEYCLTINPLRRFTNPLDFKKQIGQYLHENINNKYHFYVERSKKGKFHVHGTVSFESYESVNSFYDFLQKMEEEGQMSFKFGDMMQITDDDLYQVKETEVIPDVKLSVPITWEDYCSKQVKFWEQLEFKSKFTSNYKPNVTCVFNPKPKKTRTKNPKKKLTNAEIAEQVKQIEEEKDIKVI